MRVQLKQRQNFNPRDQDNSDTIFVLMDEIEQKSLAARTS